MQQQPERHQHGARDRPARLADLPPDGGDQVEPLHRDEREAHREDQPEQRGQVDREAEPETDAVSPPPAVGAAGLKGLALLLPDRPNN